jgi:hypothetical protein
LVDALFFPIVRKNLPCLPAVVGAQVEWADNLVPLWTGSRRRELKTPAHK